MYQSRCVGRSRCTQSCLVILLKALRFKLITITHQTGTLQIGQKALMIVKTTPSLCTGEEAECALSQAAGRAQKCRLRWPIAGGAGFVASRNG